MKTLKLSVVILVLVTFIISCGQSGSNANRTTNRNGVKQDSGIIADIPKNDAAADSQAGLYKENCMICHKDNGKGGKMTLEGKSINPIDLTSAKTKAKSDDKLLAEIKEGVPDEGMPGFTGKLSDDEIKTIIQYLRTLK